MDFNDYLKAVRQNWLMVASITLLGLILGGAISLLSKPSYSAETQLFVAIQNSGSVQELQQGNSFSQARVQSYVKTVDSPVVLQPAIDALGLPTTAHELAGRVTATTDLNTVLISITVTDESPVRAAATAQAVADSLIKAVDQLERPKSGGTSPVSLSVIKPAEAPAAPSAPNTRLNLALGLLAGLAAGLGAAIARAALDNRVRGEVDLRKVTDAPLLGAIAYDADAAKNPLMTQFASHNPRAESFRQLRTNLQFANFTGRSNSVLVTSSLPGEGKSTTATNLALALAQSGSSVCLVDADLRRPMIDQYLGLDRNAGLTTCLSGRADVNDVLQKWGDGELYVLTSGQVPPNPSELLGSVAMGDLLERLQNTFDHVIVDAPPLLPVTDAAVLSQHVGGIIVVVGSQKIKQNDLAKALNALKMVDANLFGITLNRLPTKGPDSYAYGYYEHTEDSSLKSTRKNKQKAQPTSSSNLTQRRVELGDANMDPDRPARVFPLTDKR